MANVIHYSSCHFCQKNNQNVPQLCIQITVLILTVQREDRSDSGFESDLVITIFSMFFTIISILLSSFEYVFASKFVKQGCVMVIKFDLESQAIADMRYVKFRNEVIFSNFFSLKGAISKMLHVGSEHVERLIPIQSNSGVTLVFIIDANSMRFNDFWTRFCQNVENNKLVKQLAKIYKINDNECHISVNSMNQLRIYGNKNENENYPSENIGSMSIGSATFTPQPGSFDDNFGDIVTPSSINEKNGENDNGIELTGDQSANKVLMSSFVFVL